MMNYFIISYLAAFVPIFAIFAIMPFIVRKDIFFGVNAPTDFYKNVIAKKMRNSYVMKIIFLGILVVLLSLISNYYLDASVQSIIMIISIFAMIALIMLIYISMFRKAKQISKKLKWHDLTEPMTVADTSFYKGKIAVSVWWFVLYAIIIIATIALGFIFYDKMPNEVATHTDIDGAVTYTQKSFKLIFYMPVAQLFISLVFGFVYYLMKKARPELSAQDIKKTVEQNIRFRYAWSCFMVFSGIALLLVFLVTQIEMFGLFAKQISTITSLIMVGLMIIIAIILAIKTGQSGSRIKTVRDGNETKTINRADEKHWKLGMFYVNKDDPSLFVEKRFGIGFTINFGRPVGWIVLCVIAIIIIGAIIIDR